MRPSLWFIVPAHGRVRLAQICLRQLRRTCDQLTEHGIDATAVVIADDENLDTARQLGFGTIEHPNQPVSRKFNAGIQLALDPQFNPRPADYVVPCGSDDWVDWRILRRLPGPNQILCFRHAAFVREDGREIVSRSLDYEGGVGIRVYPRHLFEPLGWRPADEARQRGCDTSILLNTKHANGAIRVVYGDLHPFQVVDWKTPGEQLNSYRSISQLHKRGTLSADPFETLARYYPADALEEMQAHYARELVAV